MTVTLDFILGRYCFWLHANLKWGLTYRYNRAHRVEGKENGPTKHRY